MPELIHLAEQTLDCHADLRKLYQGGSAVAYVLVGYMLKANPGINEDAAFVAAKLVLDRA